MNKTIIATGLVLGILAIALGAFGAHGLKKVLSVEALTTFETGVRYQMYHALLLVVIGSVTWVGYDYQKWFYGFILTGTILFCFSIYFLATNTLTSFDFKKIGWITPIGGFCLMAGWGILLFNLVFNKGN